MLEIDDALTRCLKLSIPRRVRSQGLSELTGINAPLTRLAEPLYALSDLPRWDQSAMDGYAVRASDVTPGEPLRVVEVIPAGAWPQRALAPGEAARIFTGAPLPAGADAVVIQEDCEAILTSSDDSSGGSSGGSLVVSNVKVNLGDHVRRRGEELEMGALLSDEGDPLTPGLLGLCAAQGITEARVWDAPRVALLETGTELVEPGEPLSGAQIYATHAATLEPMIKASGGALVKRARVMDDVDRVVALLLDLASADVDVIITTGGVSVGDFDPLHEALTRLGADRHFWKVRMKPGKPLSVASLPIEGERSIPMFGLPGNPVSCVVGYALFLHPLLQRAAGAPDHELGLRRLRCTLAEPISKRHRRAELMRVRVSLSEEGSSVGESSGARWRCALTGGQSSGWISSVARADGLLWTPATPVDWPVGHPVEVSLFPWWSGAPTMMSPTF